MRADAVASGPRAGASGSTSGPWRRRRRGLWENAGRESTCRSLFCRAWGRHPGRRAPRTILVTLKAVPDATRLSPARNLGSRHQTDPRHEEAEITAESWTIIGTAIAVVGVFAPVLVGIRRDLTGLTRDVAHLRERMARLEGLFEGFVRRDGNAPSPST